MDGEVPDGDRARGGTARRRARRVGRARLLLARAQPQEGCRVGARQVARDGERAARGAWHRSVHRGCDRVDRVWRTHAARRWQRRARARSRLRDHGGHQVDRRAETTVEARRCARHGVAREAGARRSQPRPDGARCDAVHADVAALPALPDRWRVCRLQDRSTNRAAGHRTAKEAVRAPAARSRFIVDVRRARHRARQTRAEGAVRWLVGAPFVRCRRRVRRYTGSGSDRVSRSNSQSSPIMHSCVPRGDARQPCPGCPFGLRRFRSRSTRRRCNAWHRRRD